MIQWNRRASPSPQASWPGQPGQHASSTGNNRSKRSSSADHPLRKSNATSSRRRRRRCCRRCNACRRSSATSCPSSKSTERSSTSCGMPRRRITSWRPRPRPLCETGAAPRLSKKRPARPCSTIRTTSTPRSRSRGSRRRPPRGSSWLHCSSARTTPRPSACSSRRSSARCTRRASSSQITRKWRRASGCGRSAPASRATNAAPRRRPNCSFRISRSNPWPRTMR